MLILGISDSHDASVALIEDGRVLAAASEERFTRRKRQQGFPFLSLEYIRNFSGKSRIDKVCVTGRYGRAVFRLLNRIYARAVPQKNILSLSSRLAHWLENSIATCPIMRDIESQFGLCAIKKNLHKAGISYRHLELTDHHYSHFISALTGIDSENYLAVSLDAYGDGKSGLIVRAEKNRTVEIKEIYHQNSIAHFYASICAYLGLREGEEGKAMALADYGRETELLQIFKALFLLKAKDRDLKVNQRYKKTGFRKILNEYRMEDIAFALQKTVEGIVIDFIKNFAIGNKGLDLFLSGGFFANIKVNQRLYETGLFKRIFIFPNMGDGGTSWVCAANSSLPRYSTRALINIAKLKPAKIKGVYLGPEYPDDYIRNVLSASGLDYWQEEDIEKRVAILLAEGKLVARFNGRMEYGPRALGNRSILYRTDDPTVNCWLNKLLRRTEYMPFAPVTLFEFKDSCYINVSGAQDAARFMTISFRCADEMKRISPAAVHIDGTARPQLIRQEDNPAYYRLLKEYYSITGIPSLINTSFNMHNEPIVCSPEDALRTFGLARIDYLAINRFLVRQSDRQNRFGT